MRWLKSIILKCDSFGYKPCLYINSRKTYSTVIGGLLGICLAISVIIGFFYFGKAFWSKSEPFVVVSAVAYDELPPIIIGKKNFYIYFGLQDPQYYQYYVDTRIYTARAYSLQYENGIFMNQTEVKVDKCSTYFKSFSEISNDTKIDPDTRYCIEPETYSLNGYWGSSYVNQIYLVIERCSNSTSNNNHCMTPDIIESSIKGAYLSFFATNYIKNINDYENPVTAFLHDNYNIVDPIRPFECVLNLKQLEFITDSGILLESTAMITQPYFDSAMYLYGKTSEINIIGQISLRGFRLGERVKRYYLKIQDIITSLGGLFKALQIIAGLLGYLISEMQYFSYSYHNYLTKASQLPFCSFKLNNTMKFQKIELTNLEHIEQNTLAMICVDNRVLPNNVKLNLPPKSCKNLRSKFLEIFCLKREQIIFSDKLRRILSIDVLCEKLFQVEFIINFLFKEDRQLNYLSKTYFESMLTEKMESEELANKNKKGPFDLSKEEIDVISRLN